MPFASLDAEQQAAFRRRLARLDLDENAIIAEELVVPEGTTMQLSPSPESGGEPRRLVTGDLDVLRRWIGTPSELEDNRRVTDVIRRLQRFPALTTAMTAAGRPPTSARGGTAAVSLADLLAIRPADVESSVTRFRAADERERAQVRPSSVELEALRAAAYTYVHGNKASAAPFKTAVEKYFGSFEVWAWLYTEIRVKRNATLVYGPGANVATAHLVVLEPGAKIRSYGHLRVDCSILRREKSSIVLPGHVLPTDIRITPRRPLIP